MAVLSEFGRAYAENLKDLTVPDRGTLKTFKDLAFENLSEAPSVVEAIRCHIKTCPANHRLPALYLLDFMLKTGPPPVYAQLISKVLLEVFSFLWDNTKEAGARASLEKVCKLWRSVPVVDPAVVAACESHMVPVRQMPVPTTHLSGGPAVVVVGTAPPDPRRAPALPPQAAPLYPVAHPAAPVQTQYGMRPVQPAQPRPPAQPYGTQIQLVLGVQAPAQAPALAVALAPAPLAPLAPSFPQTYAYSRPAYQPPAPLVFAPPAPMHAYSVPASPPASAPSPSAPAGAAQSPARSTEFPAPHALKELDVNAVRDLMTASASTRPKFLDAAFLRNKRKVAHSGTGTRPWFPNTDIWLLGTSGTSADEDEVRGAEADGEGSQEPQLAFVEEDPSQPECAISGEPFERFYDPDSDRWCYKDAVLLTGDAAAKYGVMDGSIVKVQCLAGASGKGRPRGAGLAQAAARAQQGAGSSSAVPASRILEGAAAIAVQPATAFQPAATAAAAPVKHELPSAVAIKPEPTAPLQAGVEASGHAYAHAGAKRESPEHPYAASDMPSSVAATGCAVLNSHAAKRIKMES